MSRDMSDARDQGEVRERQSSRRRSRRSSSPTISTISWRDIPAQLTARIDGEGHKLLLHARFQHAIDRAAGVAGLTSTDDYVAEWQTETSPLPVEPGSDVDTLLDLRCREIEDQYPRDRLESLVANGGLDTHPPEPTHSSEPSDTADPRSESDLT